MNKIKGDRYEIFIRNHINESSGATSYLWSHTPENILIDAGILGSHNECRLLRKAPIRDTGIDIVQVNEDGSISFVQCKSGYAEHGVRISDLAGFNAWMTVLDKAKGFVYYTDKLSQNIRLLPKNERIVYIKKPIDEVDVIEENKFDEIKLEYQIKAKNLAIEYFKENQKGIISMPCGTGKTYISYLISKEYDQVVIVSPLKQFAKQNLDKFCEYGYDGTTVLMDTDGTRDVNEIIGIIEKNKKFLLSCTYASVDILWKIEKLLKNAFIIVDEFHNLSKNNILDKEDDFYKLIYNGKQKMLFMSATPRTYELEEDEYCSEDIFGSVIYHMSMRDAIVNKYICDYKIWLPCINEDNSELKSELSIYEIDDVLKAKCMYLYSCLLNNGSRKCIVYCIDTKEIKEMREAMEKLNEFYNLELKMKEITSKTNEKKRTSRLKKFATCEQVCLMFSVRIMDESIDAISCDSIYITYASSSKIRTIQRLNRSTRIDKTNKNKVGNIYIWCNQYSDILNTLSSIKEYDEEFVTKIKINETNFYRKGNDKIINENMKLVEKYVIGITEFKIKSWFHKLNEADEYMTNKIKSCTPSGKYRMDEKYISIRRWIGHQENNYKNNKEMLKHEKVRHKWEKFRIKHKSLFESNITKWYKNRDKVDKFIKKYGKRPDQRNKNEKIKYLGWWLSTQTQSYKNKDGIMKIDEIRNAWCAFKIKHGKLLKTRLELWYENLEKVDKYIIDNEKRPSQHSKDGDTKYLGTWIIQQHKYYNNNRGHMKNEKIREIWCNFKKKHENFFKSCEEMWKDTLMFVRQYITKNERKPTKNDSFRKVLNLNNWIKLQLYNYEHSIDIMKREEMRNLWKEFVKDFGKYL